MPQPKKYIISDDLISKIFNRLEKARDETNSRSDYAVLGEMLNELISLKETAPKLVVLDDLILDGVSFGACDYRFVKA